MSTSRIHVLAGAAAMALLALSSSGVASAASRAQLRQSASPAALRTPTVGAVAAGTRIDFEVDLALPHPAAAADFAIAVSTPGNVEYHDFLTASQWEARFSPSVAAVARVERFLREQGFSVGQASPDRMEVPATGTARQIESTFDTSLSLHRVAGHVLRLTNGKLSVPASLGATIAGTVGISQTLAEPDGTIPQREPDGTIPQPPGFLVAPPCGSYYGAVTDTTLPAYGDGYPFHPPWAVCGYTPSQLRSAYGLTDGSDTGSGVTVAVVDAYASPTLESDAQTFALDNDPSYPLESSQFSELLASSFTDKAECGASGWFGEQTLDVEAVHGMAPGANILYVGAGNCVLGLNDALREVVDRGLARVISDSWGDDAGDLLDPAPYRWETDDILEMAAGTGISVLFSSGDGGDEFTTVGQVSPDYPPSSPYATAVGGTTLQIGSAGQRIGEYGWSTARSFLCNLAEVAADGCTTRQLHRWMPIGLGLDGGSGGGTSVRYSQPSYQAGVVPASLSEANGATPMRVVPDISLDADPATGMLVGETQRFPNGTYYDQYRIGGTSVASPLFAGLLARAIEADGGSSFGLVNPDLYSLYDNSSYPDALYDVGPAGKQIQSRADYADELNTAAGIEYSTRIIDYEGFEQYCPATPAGAPCSERLVALHATAGYDNMTGLGSPGTGLVAALAALK